MLLMQNCPSGAQVTPAVKEILVIWMVMESDENDGRELQCDLPLKIPQ